MKLNPLKEADTSYSNSRKTEDGDAYEYILRVLPNIDKLL